MDTRKVDNSKTLLPTKFRNDRKPNTVKAEGTREANESDVPTKQVVNMGDKSVASWTRLEASKNSWQDDGCQTPDWREDPVKLLPLFVML